MMSTYPCYCQSGIHGSDHSPGHRWIRSRDCGPRHSIISGLVQLHVGGSSCKYNALIPCRWRQRDDRSKGHSAGSIGGREKNIERGYSAIVFSEGCPSPSQAGCRVSRCFNTAGERYRQDIDEYIRRPDEADRYMVGATLFLFLLLFVHIFRDIRNVSIEADMIYGPSR